MRRIAAVVVALTALVTLSATASHAQYRPATTTAAKHPPFKPPATVAPGRGSIGGPAHKPGGVGGLASRAGGINGTVRPRY